MAITFSSSKWPAPNPEVEAALGRFIIAWAVLEQQLDFAIQELAWLEHDVGSAVTANLGNKAKLDMCQALAHVMDDVIGEALVADLYKLAAETGNASGEIRNFIAHGQPFHLLVDDTTHEVWVRVSARKGGVKGTMVGLTAEYLDNNTETVRKLVERWEAIRKRAFRKLQLWHSMPDELKEPGDKDG